MAVALVDPTSNVVPDAPALPDGAVAAAGVTEYRIIDQKQNEDDSATLTAELVGSELGQLVFTLRKGGPQGQDWLVSELEPGFSTVSFELEKHWTLTLADGTALQIDADGDRAKISSDYYLLPGASLAGATWSNDDGYYEPIPVEVTTGSEVGYGIRSYAATDKLRAEAKNDIESAISTEITKIVTAAKSTPNVVQLITAPSLIAIDLVDDGQIQDAVSTEVTIDSGEYQLCGHWTSTTKYDLKSFPFGFEGSYVVPYRYNPYSDEIDLSQMLINVDRQGINTYNAVALTECGV